MMRDDQIIQRLRQLEQEHRVDNLRMGELATRIDALEEWDEERRRDLEVTCLGLMVLGILNLGLMILHLTL